MRVILDIPLVWYSMAGIDMYINQVAQNDDRIDVVLNTDSEDLIQLVSKVKDLNVTVFRRDMDLAGIRFQKLL